MKPFFVIYAFLLVTLVSLLGFRGCKFEQPPLELFPDMDRQAKLKPQAAAAFFEDGRADREPIAGTVPVLTEMEAAYPHLAPDGRFRDDPYLLTGQKPDGTFGDGIPAEIAINRQNMARGQELYDIYCIACHGQVGNGKGVVAADRYGFNTIQSLLQARIMDQPDGEIYNTIANGKNTMYPYGAKIRVEDRWKVVMYVRALQRANTATVEDVPADAQEDLAL